MINQFGADAVRWFILSDSPPEKDVQWSDSGVSSANKFLQKIWNLNHNICNRKQNKIDKNLEKKFSVKVNNFVNKVDQTISEFRFNVTIANFYEIFRFLRENINKEISNNILNKSAVKIMKLMIPFTPHLALECLELLNSKTFDDWPVIEKSDEGEIKIAVQINGKTRDVIEVKKDMSENEIKEIVLTDSKAQKYFKDNKIIKTIFVKNIIVNYIIS